jgi:hypothetical protein
MRPMRLWVGRWPAFSQAERDSVTLQARRRPGRSALAKHSLRWHFTINRTKEMIAFAARKIVLLPERPYRDLLNGGRCSWTVQLCISDHCQICPAFDVEKIFTKNSTTIDFFPAGPLKFFLAFSISLPVRCSVRPDADASGVWRTACNHFASRRMWL